MKKYLYSLLCGILFLSIVFALCACGEKKKREEEVTEDEIVEELEDGNYEEAVRQYNLYDSSAKGSIERLNRRFINELYVVYGKYRNEELDYESALEQAEILEDVSESDVKEAHKKVWLNILDLKNSRIVFQKAEEYYQNGDYENAYCEYEKVIEEDNNYDSAQDRMEELTALGYHVEYEGNSIIDITDKELQRQQTMIIDKLINDELYDYRDKATGLPREE